MILSSAFDMFIFIVGLIVALIAFLALTGAGGVGVTQFGQATSVILLTILLVTSSGMGLNLELKKGDKKNKQNVIYYGVTIGMGVVLFLSILALNHEVLTNTLKKQVNKVKPKTTPSVNVVGF